MNSTTSNDIELLAVRHIFSRGRYVVPVYQRAYAWGESQILTLLQDVSDYRQRNAASYYIGSLVTHRAATDPGEVDVFEVVDGQQRLTTLFIILSVLSDHSVSLSPGVLSYEGRATASRDLALLMRPGDDAVLGQLSVAGIRVAVEAVRGAYDSGQFTQEDLDYMVDHVKVARTTLPGHTDLNHYFEVMNSRGEQLEKHEIVKAHLMSRLAHGENASARSHAFAVVWDACSDMSRHVQARFPAAGGRDVRSKLFGSGSWDDFQATGFDDIVSALKTTDGVGLQPTALSTILGEASGIAALADTPDDDAPERYGAIIDFPNFLLHVLALSDPLRPAFSWADTESVARVSLDDKKLVEQFESWITTTQQAESFAFTLLRARYLFDKFVIKTDLTRAGEEDSNWVLNRVRIPDSRERKLSPISTFGLSVGAEGASRIESDHWHVVMLQSMFQVTDSRRAYKTFMYAILDYLYRQEHVAAGDFIAFMQGLARDRYVQRLDAERLDAGTSVSHFVLNYLDYLLWLDVAGMRNFGIDIGAYRFRYRTSIEHYYPQNPDPDSQIEKLPKEIVDQFGNLCIMTRSENSQRSNLAPAAKVGQYRSERQTLKFQLMAAITKASSGWEPAHMSAHGEAMREVLQRATRGPGTA